ncbi:MAG TPA: hypothetical protein VF480_00875 [Verrucomicrobiae bacterium]|jgi:ornithine decarboxylase
MICGLGPVYYHLKSFKRGPTEICSVFGPTCDALDVVSMAENLPGDLQLDYQLYSEQIGAYSHASSAYFNGFPPATVVHVNQLTVVKKIQKFFGQ